MQRSLVVVRSPQTHQLPFPLSNVATSNLSNPPPVFFMHPKLYNLLNLITPYMIEYLRMMPRNFNNRASGVICAWRRDVLVQQSDIVSLSAVPESSFSVGTLLCTSGSIDLIDCLRNREEEDCDTDVNCVDVRIQGGKLLLKTKTNRIESIVPAICLKKYVPLTKKGEGTFSEVIEAQCRQTSTFVAVKCMKGSFESIEQVTRMREIRALQKLSPHPNIINLLEVLYDPPTRKLCLVFDLMEMNAYDLIRGRDDHLTEDRVKGLMYQLLLAMDHMHCNGIFHRDIKPENILVTGDSLKLADFGSCRNIYSKHPYTDYVATRWYRAPECLLTDGYYTYKMDMWGVGCVLFEIVSLNPLFPGNNELDQIQKIHQILGTPPQSLLDKMKKRSGHADFNFPSFDGTGIASLIPHASAACVELVNKLLAYDPAERLSARQALAHTYFQDLQGKEQLPEAFHAACPTRSPIVWDSLMSPRPSKFFSLCRDCFDDVIPM